MSNTEFRYRIEMRAGSSEKWLDTGLAIKPQSGADGSVVVIADVPVTEARVGVLHVSESNIFDPRRETLEEFNERQSSGDLDALQSQITSVDIKCVHLGHDIHMLHDRINALENAKARGLRLPR